MSSSKNAANQTPRDVKVCLLGAMGVGKTCVVLRFITREFEIHSRATVGASFMSTKVVTSKGDVLKMSIWDTAGQEKYRGLAPMYYRGAAAIVLVFSITERESFKALDAWIDELQTNGLHNGLIAIVGNKSDLEDARKVQEEEGARYAAGLPNAFYMETSAKAGTNVELLFNEVANRIPLTAPQTGAKASPPGPSNVDLKSKNDAQKLDDGQCSC